jgi:hypothetical protein
MRRSYLCSICKEKLHFSGEIKNLDFVGGQLIVRVPDRSANRL